MKLPESLKYTTVALQWADAEAIVRDCANTCIAVGADSVESQRYEDCANEILERYGLDTITDAPPQLPKYDQGRSR